MPLADGYTWYRSTCTVCHSITLFADRKGHQRFVKYTHWCNACQHPTHPSLATPIDEAYADILQAKQEAP
jgi:hypothetical protein